MAPNEPVKITISPKAPFKGIEEYLSRFLFAKVAFSAEAPKGDVLPYPGFSVIVGLDKSPEEIRQGLLKEKERVSFEIQRGSKMLSNPGFLAKAPKEKLALEQAKLKENESKLSDIECRLSELGN